MLKRILAIALIAIMTLTLGFTTVFAEKDSDKMTSPNLVYTGDYKREKI